MKLGLPLSLSLALIMAATPGLAQTAAGFASLRDSSVTERPLSLSIWYPSQERASGSVGGNAVFEGAPAAADAPVPDGPFPLVVVSHGGLRSASDTGAWLSASMARAGHVVVEVNAPRPDDAAGALDEIWRRPEDIRRALDLVLADETWGPRIDDGRVSVLGFALGATAALSVAGARMDARRYLRSCAAEGPAEGPDCPWYAAQGVDLSETGADGLEGLVPDRRVSAVIAVNPEYAGALGGVPDGVRVLRITLGDAGTTSGATSGEGGMAQAVVMPDASAFDAFALCTDAGPEILIEEGGDPAVCGVSAEVRQRVHREVSDAVVWFVGADRD